MPLSDRWARYLPVTLRSRLDGPGNAWQIITNIGWLFGDRIVRMGVGLFIGVWVARYLGPSQFGLLNYAFSYVGLFIPVAMLGLDQIVVRDLVQHPQDRQVTLGTTFVLKLAAGILTLVAAVALLMILKPDDHATHLLVAICGLTLVFQSFDTIDFWFQSQVRSKYAVIARNGGFLITAALRVGLVVAGASVVYFAAGALLEVVLSAAGLLIAFRISQLHTGRWRVSSQRAISLLRASWPLVFASLAVVIYMRIDQIMLGEMLGDSAVGLYAAAVRISEVWYFVPGVVVGSVAPAILQVRETDLALYRQRMQALLNSMALLGYAIAIPVTLLSGLIIRLLYGAEFAEAGPTLAVHIWAGLFVCLGVAQSMWLVNEGHTRYTMVSTLIGAVLNVLLNLLLIPNFGVLGAAIATLVSYGVVVGVVCWCYRPIRTISTMTFKAMFLRG